MKSIQSFATTLLVAATAAALSTISTVVVVVEAQSSSLNAGDTICVEGYVMDQFCIDRGTLFDNPSVPTLEDPAVHSVHCLIDVPQCIESPFELLLDPSEPGGLYNRGFRLDDDTKAGVVDMAKEVGSCTDCLDNSGQGHVRGFRIVMNATIVDLNADDPSTPPTIRAFTYADVTANLTEDGQDSNCMTYFGMPDILDVAAAASSGGEEEEQENNQDVEEEQPAAEPLAVGSEICVNGYVMDHFCIERGTFLDAQDTVSLEFPDMHSFHCLIDVESCVTSPFEVLLPPTADSGDGLYRRGFRLDEESHQMAVALAKSVGQCDVCDNVEDAPVMGFSAVMKATITALNEDLADVPPTLMVTAMEDTTTYAGDVSACMSFFEMQDIVDMIEATSTNDVADCSDEEEPLAVGDNVCIEGYVMDNFCIERGTFLDAPDINTLENPELHSFHCLIDVESCVTSPFDVLLDPKQPGDMYQIGWRLDEEAHQMAVALAQKVGECDVCDNVEGAHTHGFRAVMSATITNLNEDDANLPPTIQVHAIEDTSGFDSSGEGQSACMKFFAMKDVAEKSSSGCSSSSSSGGGILDGIISDSNTAPGSRNKLLKMYLAHGSLMMLAWGLLLPSGAIMGRFMKHRPNGLWFQLHRSIQMIGLCIALIGWIIALSQFNVFGSKGLNTYRHGVLGCVVMTLGLLQPLNAVFRPHPAKDGEDPTTARIVWEYVHKGWGWLAVLLAIPTIGLGTVILPDLDEQKTFQIAYGVGCGGLLLGLIGYCFYDKKTYVAVEDNKDVKVSDDEEMEQQPRESNLSI